MLLEAGVRLHSLAGEPPPRPDAPSGFAMKVRKHLRSRRLESVRQVRERAHMGRIWDSGAVGRGGGRRTPTKLSAPASPAPPPSSPPVSTPSQLGCDRLVDLAFGSGDGTHHLLLELHSHGNIILTDADYGILTLQRSHRDDAKVSVVGWGGVGWHGWARRVGGWPRGREPRSPLATKTAWRPSHAH